MCQRQNRGTGARSDATEEPRERAAESPLAAATFANLQALLALEPPEPFLVHCQALSLQQEMQTPVAKPATYLRQLPNAQPHGTVIQPPAPAAHRRPVNT